MANIKDIVLIIAIVLITMILIDLLFNFSGVLMKNYESFTNNSLEDMKSVVSKRDGKIINVRKIGTEGTINSQDVVIPSPSSYKNIAIDDDGILTEETPDPNNTKQQWKVIKISSKASAVIEFKNATGLEFKTDNTCTTYPFYIVKSKKKNEYCLQYESGKLTAAPSGNYDSQKWDISDVSLSGKSVCTHNTMDSSSGIGNLRQGESNQEVDPDKIKLNLNVNNEILKKLFGNINTNSENSESTTTGEGCDKHISKDSVCSLCPGCCNL